MSDAPAGRSVIAVALGFAVLGRYSRSLRASVFKAMSKYDTATVQSVHHWTDTLFSFTCTREASLRFNNGEFTMVGLEVDGKPLARAYSIVSPNYEEHLEFFSIRCRTAR